MAGASFNNIPNTFLGDWDMANDFLFLLGYDFLNNRDIAGVGFLLLTHMFLHVWNIANALINDLTWNRFKSVSEAVRWKGWGRGWEGGESCSSCWQGWESSKGSWAKPKKSGQVKTSRKSWGSSSRSYSGGSSSCRSRGQTRQGIEKLQWQSLW